MDNYSMRIEIRDWEAMAAMDRMIEAQTLFCSCYRELEFIKQITKNQNAEFKIPDWLVKQTTDRMVKAQDTICDCSRKLKSMGAIIVKNHAASAKNGFSERDQAKPHRKWYKDKIMWRNIFLLCTAPFIGLIVAIMALITH